MLVIKESVLSLKEKTTQHGFSYRQSCPKVLNIFYDWPLNINFDDLGKWLLGYRIHISGLYLLQGHYFILCDYEVQQMNIVFVLFWAKVHL